MFKKKKKKERQKGLHLIIVIIITTIIFITLVTTVHFTSVLWLIGLLGGRGGMTDSSAEILLQTFLQEAMVSRSGIGRDVHSLILSIQPFLCRPGCCVLKDGFGEAIVVCDMPKLCDFPSLDSCQMRFLLTLKEVNFWLCPLVRQHKSQMGIISLLRI